MAVCKLQIDKAVCDGILAAVEVTNMEKLYNEETQTGERRHLLY